MTRPARAVTALREWVFHSSRATAALTGQTSADSLWITAGAGQVTCPTRAAAALAGPTSTEAVGGAAEAGRMARPTRAGVALANSFVHNGRAVTSIQGQVPSESRPVTPEAVYAVRAGEAVAALLAPTSPTPLQEIFRLTSTP